MLDWKPSLDALCRIYLNLFFFKNSCQLYHIVFWSFCALGRWQQVRWSVVEPSWLSSPSQESQLVRKWEARRPGRRKAGIKGRGGKCLGSCCTSGCYEIPSKRDSAERKFAEALLKIHKWDCADVKYFPKYCRITKFIQITDNDQTNIVIITLLLA